MIFKTLKRPYFAALPCINNLETQRSPETTVNLENGEEEGDSE